ncbi:sugar ABC transporter substrate-binding protein [Domibacillus epiphyticus]|uniref:ATPase n=1 Tax=Domibacillus epiphyticus TaxID=1714355 RepID=A0A1V2A6L8_9BACI|nr:substrate-binding domain-containing protein [Domibacillus epiphyticus]OMP66653.1 ATPase [Domibacillus epiphyticus]
MNYLLKCGLALVLFTGLAACSAQEEKPKTSAEDVRLTAEDQVYVGFVLDTLKDERWYKDKELFEEAAESKGAHVKTLAANGNDDVQLKQAELLIEEGVDVLVVVPHDAAFSAAIVDMAHKAGVKVISYDRLITNSEVDYYISFDNVKVGELQASEVVKQASNGNFAYIGGAESDNNAVLFRQGAMNVLKPLIDKGSVKLIHDQYTDGWDPITAEQNMKTALAKNGNNVDAVIAANDGTAGGVINSLSSVGLAGRIPVSGQDAELEGVRRVVKGTQTMTVYKPITLLAEQAADMAVKVGSGEDVAADQSVHNGKIDVPSLLLEPVAVTKENVRDTVIKDGYLTEKDVYQ